MITISAGGRHSLVLALPDNGDLLHHDLDISRVSPVLRASQGSLHQPDFLSGPPGARSDANTPLTPEIPPGGAPPQGRSALQRRGLEQIFLKRKA